MATTGRTIAAAAAALKARSLLIDGEAVVADARGAASFNLLRGRAREAQVFVWAFHLLELDGEDLRARPLARRKGELQVLLKRAPFGLALNDYVAGDGPALIAQACAIGLEGIVSGGARPIDPAARRTGSRRRTRRAPPRGARRSRTGEEEPVMSESAVLRKRAFASENLHRRRGAFSRPGG